MQRYEIIANFARMEGVKNIESLSLRFTLGIAAGALLPASPAGTLPAMLLPLLALPLLFRKQLIREAGETSVGIVLATFLLLGVFCAQNASLPGAGGSLTAWAEGTAARLRTFIGSLPFPSEGTVPLLNAFLTGDRSGLSAGTVSAFRQSGASHLLALSGLHMGIIYLFFDRCTSVLGHSRAAGRIRAGLIISASGFFTLMTGAGPSIVRAFLFISINELLRASGRPRTASRVFCLALLIQLALDPTVIRSLGFQLSYLAMAGIFFIYPRLEKWYPAGSRYNPLRRLWQTAALGISCQITTAPLAWLRFHTFPRYFLLTNLMAIPLTTLLMGTAVVTVGLSAIGICPGFLYTTTDGLSRLLIWVLEIISSI